MRLARGARLERHATAKCAIEVARPAPTLFLSEIRGHLDMPSARFFNAFIPRVVREDGCLRGFHDWELMNDYDADARNLLTETTVMNLRRIEVAHF